MMLNKKNTVQILLLSVSTLALAGFQHQLAEKQGKQRDPALVLWSWEHNDDLSFVDPKNTAVAFYAGTIMLGYETASLLRRKNWLKTAKNVSCFPVFRIENAHKNNAASSIAFEAALEIIRKYLDENPSAKIQIDYDAGTEDRKSYLQFLQDLRRSLPRKTALSITALASWCLDDKWLQSAPIDEAVAMMFSMGKGKNDALKQLSRQSLDSGGSYQQSLGLSINETGTNKELKRLSCLSRRKPIYAFSSLGWTKDRYNLLLEEVKQE